LNALGTVTITAVIVSDCALPRNPPPRAPSPKNRDKAIRRSAEIYLRYLKAAGSLARRQPAQRQIESWQ
jgi:hypothetical protein